MARVALVLTLRLEKHHNHLLAGSELLSFRGAADLGFFCLVNFIYLFIFGFLGPHPWHMEVPKLGVESELKLPAYTTATDSNARSKPRLQSTPQLTAMPDP